MRHPSQRTNYATPTTVSPYETKVSGAYVVEKLLNGEWRAMSHGNAPGGELDRLIRCAEACGGSVRIVRRRDSVVVWERKATLVPVASEESE